MKNTHKIISVILFTAVIMVALGLARCPIVPNTAVGQEKIKFVKDNSIWVAIQDSNGNININKDWPILALLYEYHEYSAECFPDSIEFIPPNIFLRLDPTLPGFMQFLEEKYK